MGQSVVVRRPMSVSRSSAVLPNGHEWNESSKRWKKRLRTDQILPLHGLNVPMGTLNSLKCRYDRHPERSEGIIQCSAVPESETRPKCSHGNIPKFAHGEEMFLSERKCDPCTERFHFQARGVYPLQMFPWEHLKDFRSVPS